MKNLKRFLIGLITILVLTYLLNTVRSLEHQVGKLSWDIEEVEREIGFLQLEILTQELP